MWRSGRRRQRDAANAIVDIVHESALFVRAMAHTRESLCDEFFPGTDYQEQIRELADVCDNLMAGLRPRGRRTPVDALQYTWDSRSVHQQQWIRQCLKARGSLVENHIATAPDRRRREPS